MRVLLLVAAVTGVEALAQTTAKPLLIVDASVQQFEDGPAITSEPFRPGETVFFSFQVRGYSVSAGGKVQFTYRIEVMDPDGVLLVEPATGEVATELSEQDKDWLPKVRHNFLIPPHALSGRFRILAVVRDARVAGDAKSETAFTLQSRQLDTSGPLAVRNVRFFRGEDDPAPLAAAVYRPGDTLWARFDVTGFKQAEGNRVHVAYGLSIISPSGKPLFSEPRAAEEQDSSFYPKRYVPGVISLTIQPKTTPGEYTLLITARDEVGSGTCETRSVFRVEP